MLALFSPVFAPQSSLLSDSNWSLSFAAVLFVVILNTPMLFVASGKPSGAPSAVVVFLLAEILIFDGSLYSIQTYICVRMVVHIHLSVWDSLKLTPIKTKTSFSRER